MNEGQTEDIRQETRVTPAIPSQVIGVLADTGEKIMDQAQQSRIQSQGSSAQLALADLQNQYQTANQADPAANIGQYNQQRQQILDQYGSTINPFYKQDWVNHTQNIKENNDAAMEAWQIKQSKENFVVNVNQSLKDNFTLANQNGSQYGQGKGDIDSFLNFAGARKNIEEFGNQHLGETTTQAMLMDFNKDYAKSFIAGVAETNPQKAAQLMNDPRIKDTFSSEQQDEMIGLIKTIDKHQQLQQSYAQGMGNADIMGIVNAPDMNYFQKRQQIDMMDAQGSISSKAAASARRLLTSTKNVDSVTDEKTMADIITQASDLNSTAGMSNADYLVGVKNIQEKILEAQGKGQLNVIDSQKLTNQVRSLTQARIASATGAVGNDFADANKIFQGLPPEMRNSATRQLFYQQSDSQEKGLPPLTKEAMTAKAHQIVDGLNGQRRAAALQTVNNVTRANTGSQLSAGGGMDYNEQVAPEDLSFLKSKDFTPDDVKETAARYGMNPADVIRKMKDAK